MDSGSEKNTPILSPDCHFGHIWVDQFQKKGSYRRGEITPLWIPYHPADLALTDAFGRVIVCRISWNGRMVVPRCAGSVVKK